MAIEKFKLATLATIDDGRIREAFEQALKRCETDCKDRPALKDPRRVTLSAVLVPIVGDNGEMESCDVQFQIVDAIPRRKSKVYNMKSTPSGLLLNELSAHDINQRTLDDIAQPKKTANAR